MWNWEVVVIGFLQFNHTIVPLCWLFSKIQPFNNSHRFCMTHYHISWDLQMKKKINKKSLLFLFSTKHWPSSLYFTVSNKMSQCEVGIFTTVGYHQNHKYNSKILPANWLIHQHNLGETKSLRVLQMEVSGVGFLT